jgi:hypothetical protein
MAVGYLPAITYWLVQYDQGDISGDDVRLNAAIGLALTALFVVSANVGVRNANACRAANREWRSRMEEEAAEEAQAEAARRKQQLPAPAPSIVPAAPAIPDGDSGPSSEPDAGT